VVANVSTTYARQMYGGGLPGSSISPVNAAALSPSDLALSTASQAYYIENQFEELFTSTQLNLTKWRPSGSAYATGVNGKTSVTPWGTQEAGPTQDHCPAAGAVGAASPSTCTLLNPATLQVGAQLPDYPTSDGSIASGTIMTLSQRPCFAADGSNNPNCCSPSTLKSGQRVNVCAAWSGAHLSSQFGAQFGVLEVEAKFNLPSASNAYMFFGTYIYSCQNSTRCVSFMPYCLCVLLTCLPLAIFSTAIRSATGNGA
jgi:hypothetical protein